MSEKIDFSKPCHVHFIGIGGISMSGLAEILIDRHFTVSGSDRAPSGLTEHLEKMGAKISFPQNAGNVTDDIDMFVYTSAIHPDNPEFAAALATGKPVLKRAELLGQIMEHYKNSVAVAGTHGKTTTTSMISQVLLEYDPDPTILVGAIFPAIHSNVRSGSSENFVAEACEYTDSFLNFYPEYAVILNVEAEHLDYFKTLDNEISSFHKFARNIKKGGLLVINGKTNGLEKIISGIDADVLTYGFDDSFDCHPLDIEYKNGYPSFIPLIGGQALDRIQLNVPGEHNVGNALASIAVLLRMGLPFDVIKRGLEKYAGADRRFQYKGTLPNGAVIIDDYAHHPTEIRASLNAALHYPHKRLIVAFQPHTYTRLKSFLNDFADALSLADYVVLADVFAAREKDVYGVNSSNLFELLKKNGMPCSYFHTFEEIEDFLEKNSTDGDLLITMGAGNIVEVGEKLLSKAK